MHYVKQAQVVVVASLLAATGIAACAVKQTAEKVDQSIGITYPPEKKNGSQ